MPSPSPSLSAAARTKNEPTLVSLRPRIMPTDQVNQPSWRCRCRCRCRQRQQRADRPTDHLNKWNSVSRRGGGGEAVVAACLTWCADDGQNYRLSRSCDMVALAGLACGRMVGGLVEVEKRAGVLARQAGGCERAIYTYSYASCPLRSLAHSLSEAMHHNYCYEVKDLRPTALVRLLC